MAEFIKVEIVGTVNQSPYYTTGLKKDGTEYQLGSVNIKADNQFVKCVGFGSVAEFIKELEISDRVYIVGQQKIKKGKDEKWYSQIDISFISSNNIIAQESTTKVAINSPYDLMPQAEPKKENDGVNPHSFMTNSNNSEDDLPF